ncbi:MFS transporter [Microbispora triticiradicis]|uniref:MFS transporter n=1 Tax=Microbispora triticiradicis TaxID=2200763 RepID=UPI001AD6905E|nr:MFS transporter [Microbispora triticiradicis]MBO4273398.1 MFS transporter [Microbispora triticiradicis]
MTPSHTTAGRPWPMLAVLLAGQFMGLLDLYIVNVAIPRIGADLGASGATLQLVVGGYIIAYATLLITGARLGELCGRRRMYLIGVAGFTAGSLLCGLAPDIGTLIAFRFVQGAAAAVMVPQIMSVIQARFTGRARATALSAYTAVLSAGSVVGLALGGVLVGAGWRPVFLVNVPVGVLLTLAVPRLVPPDLPSAGPSGSRRLDLRGLALALPATLLLVLPLVLGRESGWPKWTYASIAVGVALAVVFVVAQRRTAARGGDPLLNVDVLRVTGMPSGLVTLVALMVAYGGFLFTFALHLQSVLGESPLRAGLTFLPMAAAFGLGSFYWRRLPRRIHHLLPAAGLALNVLGASCLAVSAAGGMAMWAALVVYGAGLGVSTSLLTHALVHVPPARAADASGLLTTTMQFGQLSGVAVFGAVFLALADPPRPEAMGAIAWWLALAAATGMAGAVALARAVAPRARQAPPTFG